MGDGVEGVSANVASCAGALVVSAKDNPEGVAQLEDIKAKQRLLRRKRGSSRVQVLGTHMKSFVILQLC